MKNLNICKKAACGFLTITLTAGLAVGNISDTYAEEFTKVEINTVLEDQQETIKTLKPGTFIDGKKGNVSIYIAKKGDNASVLSRLICDHLGMERTTKYWPVIALLNKHIYPGVLQPLDIVLFPNTPEKLIALYDKYDKEGKITDYKVKNNVYGKKQPISRESLRSLLIDIFGKNVCVDDDFLLKYLKATGLSKRYTLSDVKDFTGEQLFELTDYIPELNELVDIDNDIMTIIDESSKLPTANMNKGKTR